MVASAVDGALWLALRDPGGAWSAPLRVRASAGGVAVAVSARGDAVAAWPEVRENGERRVRVIRRLAGSLFGAPESLTGWERNFALGQRQRRGERRRSLRGRLRERDAAAPRMDRWCASPSPGRMRRSGPRSPSAPRPRSAARDSSWPRTGARCSPPPASATVTVYERAPGGSFGSPQVIPAGVIQDEPALALRPGGAAALAWRGGAVVRDGPGAFGTPVSASEGRGALPRLADARGAGRGRTSARGVGRRGARRGCRDGLERRYGRARRARQPAARCDRRHAAAARGLQARARVVGLRDR